LVEISNLKFPEKPSRISTIFYFGLEGFGGLDMETDENENVRFKRQEATAITEKKNPYCLGHNW
jgi:hypothetical protein